MAGFKTVELKVDGFKVNSVKVDMGKPLFNRKCLPMFGDGTFIEQELNVSGSKFKASCVSVGNPHCVVFVQGIDNFPLEKWGPLIENHHLFPNRVNVEFAENFGDRRIKVRTWERGCGETLACGTGACAVTAVANRLGKVKGDVKILLKGGVLKITLKDGRLIMEGPATKVYTGLISDEVLNIEV